MRDALSVEEMNVAETGLDQHDPAGMARWLRWRAKINRDRAHEPLERWEANVWPHIAFRLEQAADMIERLDRGEHICTRCYHRMDPPAGEPTF